ncbi:MAG: hypothetical protein DMD86_18385, partial [Candidatus Rokuibacteriota bacterium]
MLASDGGAPAPRRPAAHTASLGGGFGKGGEAPSEFDGMAILVTGAFGCIGAWVVKRLLAAGERPVVYDLGDDPWRMRMIVGSERLHDVAMIRGDIADRDAVVRVVGEHDITHIIHLAASQVPLCRQDPSRGALVNVVGTANVFEAAKAHRDRVRRVVYFSSAAVFGPPHLYGPGPVTDDAPPRPAHRRSHPGHEGRRARPAVPDPLGRGHGSDLHRGCGARLSRRRRFPPRGRARVQPARRVGAHRRRGDADRGRPPP